jgi:hypothetical protein
MTKDEALRLALEALEMLARYENPETKIQIKKPKNGGQIVTMYPHKVATEAAEAIKAALEAKDEPVAWLHKETGLLRKETISSKGADWDENHWKPLYTTPPQRKPLSDEQTHEAIGTAGVDLLELAKLWSDNKIHVYQFDNEAQKIIKAVLLRAHGIIDPTDLKGKA